MKTKESEGFEFRDRNIISITDAVVGISEGNYVSAADISTFAKNLFPDGILELVFPILSRNRFFNDFKKDCRKMNKITMLIKKEK